MVLVWPGDYVYIDGIDIKLSQGVGQKPVLSSYVENHCVKLQVWYGWDWEAMAILMILIDIKQSQGISQRPVCLFYHITISCYMYTVDM